MSKLPSLCVVFRHTDCKAEYKYFTRNSFDTSNSYRRHWEKIRPLFKPDVTGCILDGEMVNYDPERKVFITKGEGGMDVKNHGDARDDDDITGDGDDVAGARSSRVQLQPCLIVFDILYLNGNVLTEHPLDERLRMLRNAFTELEGWLMIAETKVRTKHMSYV